jgi:hypothetical protein
VSGSRVRPEVRRFAASGICEMTGVSGKTGFRETPAGLADGLGLGSVRRHVAATPQGRLQRPSSGSPVSREWRETSACSKLPPSTGSVKHARDRPLPSMLRYRH